MNRYYISILITIVFFSTIEVCVKLIGAAIDPLFLAFLRFFGAGFIICATTPRQIAAVAPRDLAGMAGLGILGVSIGFGAFHIGLRTIDAAPAAVIFSVNPLFSYVAAAAALGERFSLRRAAGLLVGIAGAWVAKFGLGAPDQHDLLGPGLILLSAAAFGTYVALAKLYVRIYGPRVATGLIFVIGSLPLAAVVRDFSIRADATGWAAMIYLILFATGLAYLLYFYGLRKLPIGAGTALFYLKPVLAPLFAAAVLGERLSAHLFAGAALVLLSLALAIGPPTRRMIAAPASGRESQRAADRPADRSRSSR